MTEIFSKTDYVELTSTFFYCTEVWSITITEFWIKRDNNDNNNINNNNDNSFENPPRKKNKYQRSFLVLRCSKKKMVAHKVALKTKIMTKN